MAKLENGIFGTFSGKVGNIVGVNIGGRNYIRAAPRKSSKEPSASQLKYREKFKLISSFLRPFNPIFTRYFGNDQGVKSRVNQALSYHIREAMVEQDENFSIDMEKVVLSKGTLPLVNVIDVHTEDCSVTLNWTLIEGANFGNGDDLLTVVGYNLQNGNLMIHEKVATRDALTASVLLPMIFEINGFAVWLFFTNREDTECSTSVVLLVD
ncbi:DUF6266 family protein [Myroides fluvii]|uniref:DUF6266 family protein n=1 Tax=Myroides fluvii TaxID=2572594 RepID=UPI00131B38B5|nr:DUF6266 family protein [Myroides fluvii]